MSKQRLQRQLFPCQECGKPGYQYETVGIRGHPYIKTVHRNEPPIRIDEYGKPVYRECFKNGRIYFSLEDAIKSEIERRKQQHQQDDQQIQKQRKVAATKLNLLTNCSKCHKRGRLNMFKNKGVIKFVIIHSRSPLKRCYIRKGKQSEIMAERWSQRQTREKTQGRKAFQ